MTGVMVTIPHAFHGRGECPDAGYISHTIRSVQPACASKAQKQLPVSVGSIDKDGRVFTHSSPVLAIQDIRSKNMRRR